MLALVSVVAYFHVYFATNKFTIYTDHKALTWLQTIKHTNSRLLRWALKLQEYKFDVIHRLGSRNQHCDALSRRNYEKQSDQINVLTEVTFIYPGETLEQITNSVKEVPFFSLEDISSLQKQCPYFGPIITFLENGTLPDDKKRAQAISYETSQYELLNDTLYHFFQPRTKTRTSKHQLIKQVAIQKPLRNDILLSFHDQKAVKEIERFIIHIVKDFIPTTIKALNPSFTVLEVVNAGSYFEHTKVKNPDEFDFMVVVGELSTPVSVQIFKGCMPGYANVKLRQKGRWHSSGMEYTPEKEFEISIISFNAYLRQAVSLVPVQKGRYGILAYQDVVVRGKPYSVCSHVQTANFIWKRKQCSVGEEMEYQRSNIIENTDNEIVNICVDMMTCCHFPVGIFSEILPSSSLSNPSLIKNGRHIVLKPCNTSSCNEKETPCRLVSYTKSEVEKMANLDENWKVIYKCTKLLFSYVEYSGIVSYKLKSTILHLSARYGHLELGRGLILVLKSLQISSSKGFLGCYFNSTLNVWSISPSYRYFTKWQIILLFKIFRVFEKIPAGENQHLLLSKMIDQWIGCTCRHSIEVSQIRSDIFDKNSLATFNVQGNIFLEIVYELEPALKAQKSLNSGQESTEIDKMSNNEIRAESMIISTEEISEKVLPYNGEHERTETDKMYDNENKLHNYLP
ncbi:unnamed protein product [Mytilus coruscus]|uniref:Reverse transcriptase RNase H-like domain-containing protein n=1 Tax=Mytilus coruscus TaxID=42192 RepID=A0A6J8C9H6_MYTCO|nr:unnamed protein product [Mytilus coruscus]